MIAQDLDTGNTGDHFQFLDHMVHKSRQTTGILSAGNIESWCTKHPLLIWPSTNRLQKGHRRDEINRSGRRYRPSFRHRKGCGFAHKKHVPFSPFFGIIRSSFYYKCVCKPKHNKGKRIPGQVLIKALMKRHYMNTFMQKYSLY